MEPLMRTARKPLVSRPAGNPLRSSLASLAAVLADSGQDREPSPFQPHPRPPHPPQPIPSVTPFPQSSLARESVRGPPDTFTGRFAPRSLFEVSLRSTAYRSPARATALAEWSEAVRCFVRGMSSADPKGRAGRDLRSSWPCGRPAGRPQTTQSVEGTVVRSGGTGRGRAAWR